MRSYLIGELYADWLDKDGNEDLIRTDRQDILWVSEEGTALQTWAHKALRILARKARQPMRKIARREFMTNSNLEEEAKKRFSDNQVVKAAVEIGKTLGSMASLDELKDEGYVNDLKELVLTIAPHKYLVDTLREINRDTEPDRPLSSVVSLFNKAKMAEMASLGQIVQERIEIIQKLEIYLTPGKDTSESELQKLLENAPWLIDPQWTVLQANRAFETMRGSFERWYETEYDEPVETSAVEAGTRRPDFIMLHVGSNVEIVEIKDIGHVLADAEFKRILIYYQAMKAFMRDNESFADDFPFLHVSVICDKLNLKEPEIVMSYESLVKEKLLKKRTWEEVFKDTCKVHEAFLERP